MAIQKNFVGKGWVVVFENDSSLINLVLNKAEIMKLPANSFGQVQVTVSERQDPDPKDKSTHYVTENTYWSNGH